MPHWPQMLLTRLPRLPRRSLTLPSSLKNALLNSPRHPQSVSRDLVAASVPDLAAVGAGIGIGLIGGNAVQAIARQPEMTGPIGTNMIITAALVEGVALFAVVVGLLGIL